jgi:hypothetical protein
VLPHGRVYKAWGAPLQIDRPYYLATHVNSRYSQSRELSCNHIHQAYSRGRRVLCISKRPEPVNLVHCPSCERHEPFCYSRRYRPTPKNTLRGNPGCAVGPKTPTTTLPFTIHIDILSFIGVVCGGEEGTTNVDSYADSFTIYLHNVKGTITKRLLVQCLT